MKIFLAEYKIGSLTYATDFPANDMKEAERLAKQISPMLKIIGELHKEEIWEKIK